MPEKIEIDLYQFISCEMVKMATELVKLEARMDRRFDELKADVGLRFNKVDDRFNKLEEEVRWPRRIAIGGVITSVIAVFVAIFGFRA
jgi:hypothetical protein